MRNQKIIVRNMPRLERALKWAILCNAIEARDIIAGARVGHNHSNKIAASNGGNIGAIKLAIKYRRGARKGYSIEQ